MKSLLASVLLLIASTAFADLKFKVTGFKSDVAPGIGKVSIQLLQDGKMTVQLDPNTCSADGRMCTEMPIRTATVTPKVIHDGRPADGNLEIGLTDWISLSVGSGYNRTRTVTYTAIVGEGDDTVSVPLTATVQTSVR